ncbi:MAG: hypothetical protein H6839_11520 [Planctomycetes bacterium]|nr:hypothetical protein [Planctomycetota bacterium]
MRDSGPMIAVAVIALLVGAIGCWFVVGATEPSPPKGNEISASGNASLCGAPLTADSGGELNTDPGKGAADAERLLNESKSRVRELEKENNRLQTNNAELETAKGELEADLADRDKRIEELKELAAGPNRLLIGFGKWAEMKEVRETDWNDLGDAYSKMTPLLKEYAAAVAEGKDVDPELAQKIGQENSRLIAYYAKVIKKLPTHSPVNGEFTHPINMVNILAGQLNEAKLPLSEDQKKQLAALGDQFDRRWDDLEVGYNDKTWALQKIYDEVELKQWFYDEMFKVTTPEQKAIAVPPEVAGLVGLDLYSPGLMLQASFQRIRGTDTASIRQQLKQGISETVGISLETLEQADFVFDDWLNGAQLQPAGTEEANRIRTLPLIRAAQLQLAAMHALDDGYVVDEEVHKKIRYMQRIALLQLLKQE